MTPSILKHLSAALAGVLFGIGLIASQMVNPEKVIGFLDVLGAWDPTLGLVMGGAIPVAAAGFYWARRSAHPWFESRFEWPSSTHIDAKLVIGSALFGVGWGMAGFCPGPALVGAASLAPSALIFVAAMLLGMGLFHLTSKT